MSYFSTLDSASMLQSPLRTVGSRVGEALRNTESRFGNILGDLSANIEAHVDCAVHKVKTKVTQIKTFFWFIFIMVLASLIIGIWSLVNTYQIIGCVCPKKIPCKPACGAW
jgi:hypothetical protein